MPTSRRSDSDKAKRHTKYVTYTCLQAENFMEKMSKKASFALPEPYEREERQPLLRERLFSDPPVPVWRKLAYSFGGLPKTCNLYVINAYYTIFLLEVAKIPAGYASIVLLVGKLMNAFSDPIIGFLISRTSPTQYLGKNRPWMLAGAPLAIGSYFAVWVVLPDETPPWAKVLYYTFTYWFYSATLMVYYIPYVSSVIGFSNSQKERDTLVAWRMTMESVGAISGLLIHAILLFMGNQFLWSMPMIYRISAGCLDLIFLLSSVIAFASIDERYILHVTTEVGFGVHYKAIIGFKPFQLLALAFFFANTGMAVVTGIYALFFEYVFEEMDIFPLCMVIIFLCGALSVPLWQLILRRFGKKTTMTIGLLGMMTLYWAHLYLKWILPLAITLAVLGGVLVGCVLLVPQSMFPDVISAFSIETGTGREPMFFTLTAFLDTAGQAVALACTTLILQFVGYKSGAAAPQQPPGVALALRLIVGCFPVVCGLVSIILIWEYPIDEAKRKTMHEQIKRNLSTVSKHGIVIYTSEPDDSDSDSFNEEEVIAE